MLPLLAVVVENLEQDSQVEGDLKYPTQPELHRSAPNDKVNGLENVASSPQQDHVDTEIAQNQTNAYYYIIMH